MCILCHRFMMLVHELLQQEMQNREEPGIKIIAEVLEAL